MRYQVPEKNIPIVRSSFNYYSHALFVVNLAIYCDLTDLNMNHAMGANTSNRNTGRNHAPKPDVSPIAVCMITN